MLHTTIIKLRHSVQRWAFGNMCKYRQFDVQGAVSCTCSPSTVILHAHANRLQLLVIEASVFIFANAPVHTLHAMFIENLRTQHA